jgi:hypothetical protein
MWEQSLLAKGRAGGRWWPMVAMMQSTASPARSSSYRMLDVSENAEIY